MSTLDSITEAEASHPSNRAKNQDSGAHELVTSRPGLAVYSGRIDSWVVSAEKPIRYEVRFCNDVFALASTDLIGGAPRVSGTRRLVVIDSTVDRLCGDRIRAYFDHHEVEVAVSAIRADETVKNFDTAAQVIRAIDRFEIARRREPIIAVGGGVLMDVVGLVASLYRRGTPFIRVPTTLIGLIDAGIGVKTGVNFDGKKNRLGAYFPAELTLLDKSFLVTLPRRQVSNGLAEALKMGLIKDRRLFDLLERWGPLLLDELLQGRTSAGESAANEVLRRSVHSMLDELQPNLWETRLERCVDYGHTFSPTIEMRALPELLHGEAVCVDMALTTILAWQRALISAEDRDRILAVMSSLELPTWDPLLTSALLQGALEDTVRHRDGMQRLPLPVGIGAVTFVHDVTAEELDRALTGLRALGRTREDLGA